MPTWDERIDEAARQLTEGQPGAGFRTRVLARLDARPRRWPRAWLLAPAAAIAIAVLVVVTPREEIAIKSENTEVGLKADTTSGSVGLKADTTSDSVGLKADTTTAPTPVEYPPDVAVAPIELEPLAVPRTVVDALAAPAPLVLEDIAIAALETLE